MQEPSVLDYFLAKIHSWKKSAVDFELFLADTPQEIDERELINFELQVLHENQAGAPAVSSVLEKKSLSELSKAWKFITALIFAIAGQSMMELSEPNVAVAIFLYSFSLFFILWSLLKKELILPAMASPEAEGVRDSFHLGSFFISLPFLIAAFITFRDNRFTLLNLFLWLVAIIMIIYSVWIPNKKWKPEKFFIAIQNFFSRSAVNLKISWWKILLLFVALMAIFFRFYQLDSVPGEMFSDQAEKLWDVQDVLDGQFSIYFPRNTGREPFQMYLTAVVSKIFGTGISFLSLKIGTALCGLAMLPYIYLIGKELGNKWVGLYALIFASFAYWPNVIARVGLRFILAAFFAAPTLYYLLRGLRHLRRNDFILCGFFLGLGLYGYSSSRFVPILILVAAGIYWLHQKRGSQKRTKVLGAVLIIVLVSFVIFLPLFRYSMSSPDMFTYRMRTRIGTAEAEYPGSPFLIFIDNLFDASAMMWFDNGSTWVHSVISRPALDLITAGFYFFGMLFIILRYIRKRNWEDLFLLISIPVLLMPSILSLAFPGENPCLNRTSAAMVPVFLVAGIGMEGLLSNMHRLFKSKYKTILVGSIAVFLLLWSAGLNYDLVFNQYQEQYMANAWNTSDLGSVIKGFTDSVGNPDAAYVVPYAHWVDTRLVGINAGYPRTDYALWRDGIPATLEQKGPKLFLFKPEDEETMQALFEFYPTGQLKFYDDQYDGRDFYIFLTQ
ncbi:MAG: glycosyltransferase family 39 protein [Anaerolineaceae bacterium]|nr:glycosyltransferase family 39 protein [Anaerolineaceae bacterium]